MVPFRYTAEMTGQQSDIQKLTKGKTWLFTLTLRQQARVVLVANIDVDRGLVNGAVGTVVGFSQATGSAVADYHRWPRVKFDGVPGEVRCRCVHVLCACSGHVCVCVWCAWLWSTCVYASDTCECCVQVRVDSKSLPHAAGGLVPRKFCALMLIVRAIDAALPARVGE